MLSDFLDENGRAVTLTFPDGYMTSGKCLIRPLLYKNKMYLEGVGTDLGRQTDSYSEMYAPPGFLPPGDLAEHYLSDDRFNSWSIVRRDTVYKGDAPAYDWVVLLERTGGTYITLQPVSTMGAVGVSCVFTVNAKDESAAYRWQVSYDNGITWGSAVGDGADTNEITIDVDGTNAGGLYRCMIVNGSGTIFSDCAHIILVTEPPVITLQPVSVTVNTGDEAVFTIEATDAQKYTWQASDDYGDTWEEV